MTAGEAMFSDAISSMLRRRTCAASRSGMSGVRPIVTLSVTSRTLMRNVTVSPGTGSSSERPVAQKPSVR